MPKLSNSKLILLTGATGYIGGRLLPALESAGYRVRCLSRHPEALRRRLGENTEIAIGDVLDSASLPAHLAEVDTAYYLVHAMGSKNSFEAEDRRAAHGFAAASREAGVKRVIYLGGLGSGERLSAHLRSRQEVGSILRQWGVQTLELRASIVIGSGSASFEMIRALVEKLPVMVTPRWVHTRTQPIAVEDVIAYLLQALTLPLAGSPIFEIGGPDQVTYLELMQEYARQRKLKRWMIPVPILSPRLSSLWLGLVTPVYARVGRELVDSLRNETIVNDHSAAEIFPMRPLGFRQALIRALANEDRQFAETRWSDAFSSLRSTASTGAPKYGRRIVDSRSMRTSVPPEIAFKAIERLGGKNGWYYGDWLWNLRGLLDLFLGGAGLRRGRRDPDHLDVGSTLDFWRVEDIQPNRLLRLSAEMRLPGRAWLQFEIEPLGTGSSLRQTAIFDPVGILGQLYWYILFPIHQLVFAGMLKGIVKAMAHPPEPALVSHRPAPKHLPHPL
jgi:uncharacterized protein YbjT (DUF2867 family)